MTPTNEIQRLDKFLRLYGSGTCTITGVVNSITYTVNNVRCHVRYYKEDELNESIIQGDSRVIISPTEMNTVGWPAIVRVPRRGFKFTWQTRTINVESAEGTYLQDTLVKITMQVRGQQ